MTSSRLGHLARIRSLTTWSVAALTLRGVVLLAPPAGLLMAGAAGSAPPHSVLAVVVFLSAGFAIAPESGFGLLALGSVIWWWSLSDDAGLHATVLVAAMLLLAAHVAALLISYGPPGVAVDAGLGWLWVGRGAAVLVAAPAVLLLARFADDAAPDPALWQAGLLVSVLAVVLVAARLTAVERMDG